MGREELFRDVKNYKTIDELKKNNWILFMGESRENTNYDDGVEDSNKNIDIWVFKHITEEGLRAKFQKEKDGTLTLLNSWDEHLKKG